jgi:hypothetical protein
MKALSETMGVSRSRQYEKRKEGSNPERGITAEPRMIATWP